MRKKILFYMNTINRGGAERVLTNLANRFSENYDVVFTTSFETVKEYDLKKSIKRLNLEDGDEGGNFFAKNMRRLFRLRKIIKLENPDLVISFLAEPNFRSILATRFLKVKNIISVRNDPNREYPNFVYRFFAKILYPKADGCVFQTEDAKSWFSEKIQKKSKIILNQVDEKFYNVKNDEKRSNIVTVGRLQEQKNHNILIKAFSKIVDKFPDEKLLLYGDGDKKEELMNLVKSLNLEDRVFFMGVKENIEEEIKNAKIFVLSSDYEGMPNALMEAMVLNIPVISTDCPCGGPKYLINHGEDGFLFKVGDVEELVVYLTKLLENDKLLDKFSNNLKIKSKDFTPDKIFKDWEDYVLKVME
ncbi:glycosyltransferase involved in cell wall biosynthesis [Oceanotoga teriensis]|uniref:Glycosyltransferase involved in cell wall biosynthesis n=1 Tax=Oceanotoga teriensis TaxID=515440 RepID=A0AA45C543_9BACT|nr:glycosyltransferase family 4 protein [Oceanotoga teriensis]PWJ88086.1 glycosyltransferase involved in cell wall biosynthesis [Oceanotoga teriensis]